MRWMTALASSEYSMSQRIWGAVMKDCTGGQKGSGEGLHDARLEGGRGATPEDGEQRGPKLEVHT